MEATSDIEEPDELSIKLVDIFYVSALSVSLLARIKHVEKCTLWRNNAEEMDMAPLRLLSRLNHLVLKGSFVKELHHLAGLTWL